MTDDPRVSKTYRETATEAAPEHINAAVLRTAAKAVRPRYSLMRLWTRPVAWAAVVMLSFALVLELTQTPVPVSANKDRQLQEKLEVHEFEVRDADMLQRAEDMARMREGASDEPLPAAEEVAAQAAMPLPEKSSLRSAATPMESETGCDESERAEPEAWLACIVGLEERGLTELANTERELLHAAFPGFTE